MDMQIDILTLFPESVDAMLNVSILGRAQERGYIAIRTHQIRAHMASIGHPLLGDYKYGDREFNDRYRKKLGIQSQMLCACRLEFPECEDTFPDLSSRILTIPEPELFEKLKLM